MTKLNVTMPSLSDTEIIEMAWRCESEECDQSQTTQFARAIESALVAKYASLLAEAGKWRSLFEAAEHSISAQKVIHEHALRERDAEIAELQQRIGEGRKP